MVEINENIITYIAELHEKQILLLQEKIDELKSLIIESDYKTKDLSHRLNNLKVHIIALDERISNLETKIQVNLTLFDYCVKIVSNWRLWFILFMLYTCIDYQHFKAISETLMSHLWEP